MYNVTSEKQRELERRVLQQLRDREGPVNWDELYVHFDLHRTGDIDPVLHHLKDGHYIAVDQEKNVSISEIGLKRLLNSTGASARHSTSE